MAILRPIFDAERILTCAQTEAKRNAALVRVAGVVLVRQRPGKGNAIFVTLGDEIGITNVVLWARMFEQFRREVMAARLMEVEGVVEKSPENVVHLVARRSSTDHQNWRACRKITTRLFSSPALMSSPIRSRRVMRRIAIRAM